MRINADFSKPAVVVPRNEDWVCSPESGVDRLMLDRVGDEVARATSIVRYAAGSSFSRHTHPKGEEFLVLEGVFSDESGDYPAGTYVRNPPGTGHAPHSEHGCRILVKLRQFEPDDLEPVVINTNDVSAWTPVSDFETRLDLYTFRNEKVAMHRYVAGAEFHLGAAGGAELFIVSGALIYEGKALKDECWLRLPDGESAMIIAMKETCLWLKTGHLDVDSEFSVLHTDNNF
ncbi:MAG: cupin domain-containing protein [Gammaproteobacteria bacterium]|nr:cupin domain-containing protein [Gammaproteobacteria bacterium]